MGKIKRTKKVNSGEDRIFFFQVCITSKEPHYVLHKITLRENKWRVEHYPIIKKGTCQNLKSVNFAAGTRSTYGGKII